MRAQADDVLRAGVDPVAVSRGDRAGATGIGERDHADHAVLSAEFAVAKDDAGLAPDPGDTGAREQERRECFGALAHHRSSYGRE